MRKLIIAILVFAASFAAVCQDVAQTIDILRNVLQNPAISGSQRNFFNAVLAVSLKNAGKEGAESDSLVNAAWSSEIRMPLEEQNYNTYQTITAYHILTANKKGAEDAVGMAEKTFRQEEEGVDSIWLAHRSFLLTAYKYINNWSDAKRIVSEDLQKISNNDKIRVSISLLNYLWNCYKFIDMENGKDGVMNLYCFSLIEKYTREYIAAVGVENVDLNLILPMFKILTKPLFAKYVTTGEIVEMLEQADLMFGNKKNLNQGDRIAYAQFLVNKAEYLMMVGGDVNKAEDAANRAIRVACNDWDRIRAYGALIAVYSGTKAFEKIPVIYPEISRLAKKIGIDDYTFNDLEAKYEMATSLKNNDAAKAIAAAQKSFNVFKDEWDNRLPFMTSADRENFLIKNGDPVASYIMLLDRFPVEVAPKLYDGILYRTGMLLRAQKETEEAINKLQNPEVKMLSDSLLNLKMAYRKLTEMDKNAIQLNVHIRNLEQKIVTMVVKENREINRLPRWNDVQDCLKDGEAAIEFIFSSSNLYALIVRKDADAPIAVPLTSNIEFLNFMNSNWSGNSVQTAKKMYKEYDGKDGLYHLLWEPMLGKLDGVRKIYMSVPGALNSISFNAIVTPTGSTLFDEYEIHQVTSTGNITEKKHEGAPGETLVLGDVAFSSQPASQKSGDDINGERGVARRHFRQLPFASLEIDSISNVLSTKKVRILSGKEASEKNFRKEIEKVPDVLHLATHGFFIADVKDALKVPFMNKHARSVNSSMQRAGVALAGAEQSWTGVEAEDDEDGILTAMEVADMDLKGVRLVALSACETALGNFSFEGIYGLPRGFKQAGVESLLVSLWSVNDKATSEFMTEFYRDWKKTKNRHAAYRMAMKKVREKYPEAFYWASFIMLD